MPLQITVRRLQEFTSVKIAGPASLPDFVAFIAELGEETRSNGDKRALVDLLGLENDFRFTDHFQIGEAAAQHLTHLERLASIVPENQITHTSEKVAVKKGLQLRVFTSMTEAIRWLTEN
ncbi:MAG: STAS/SEC14 domain-containing protein [Ramlibacter sp.]